MRIAATCAVFPAKSLPCALLLALSVLGCEGVELASTRQLGKRERPLLRGGQYAGDFLQAHRLAVEILDERRAVVLGDEVDDRRGQTVFPGERDAILHMPNDDKRAQGGLEDIVAVLARLVLDEILRLEHLADVVKVGSHPNKEAMELVLSMGMEEGLTEAVGQIDAILAEDAN